MLFAASNATALSGSAIKDEDEADIDACTQEPDPELSTLELRLVPHVEGHCISSCNYVLCVFDSNICQWKKYIKHCVMALS